MKNWTILTFHDEPEWYYVVDPTISTLLRVDTIFDDNSLFMCDWHKVVSGQWCAEFPRLRAKLLRAYAGWIERLYLHPADEHDAQCACDLHAAMRVAHNGLDD